VAALETPQAALLKYRFGNIAQMQNHLHVVDGRTLFFYRDGKGELPGGARVLLEFSFADSEQVSALRGNVLGRVEGEGGQVGMWIEFPDGRLAKKADQGASAMSGRKQRRLGCDLLVEVKQGRKPFIGHMVDVSLGGARLVGTVGLRAGADVELRLMAPEKNFPVELGRADVMRADASDAGVRFVRTDTIARVASTKLFQAVQQAWAGAPELTHPPICCRNGHVLEPPLPHMKSRI
jgi:hypothetical protein